VYRSPTHSNLDSDNNSYRRYSSTLLNCLTTPTSSCHTLDSDSSSGSMEGQDYTQQPGFQAGFQGLPPSSHPPSRVQSAAAGGSGWIDTTRTQQPQWGAEQHIPMPPGTPLQPQPQYAQQLQYAQQPQFQQPQYGQQPQYYAPPPPNFAGILHTLAQHVSALTQNSIATQQAVTMLLAKHAMLSNSIQHLNLSNQQMQQLLQHAPAITGGAASFTTKVHTMEKPEKFDSTRNNSAHTFLVCFALWAQSLGAQMNQLNAAGNRISPRHDLWVQSVLGYMTSKAAVWAEPYMTQMLAGQMLFLNAATNQILWDEFQTAFCMRWISVTDNIAACQKLVTLCQGMLSVKAFWSRFKVLANRSGLSEVDLLERFKASVNEDILMTMAKVYLDKKSLATWTCAAIELDLNRREAENITCTKKGKAPLQASGEAKSATAPTKPSVDPGAMDVNAVYLNVAASILTSVQNAKWKEIMKDRCYVCGDKTHCFKECGVRKDHKPCGHCEGKGHTQTVCLHRFAGLAPGPAPKCSKKPSRHAAIGRLEDNKAQPFDLGVSPDVLDSASAATGDNDKTVLKLGALTSGKKKKNKKKAAVESSELGEFRPVFLDASPNNLRTQLACMMATNQELLENLKVAQAAAVDTASNSGF
jgi:hypothetical protein